MINQERLVKNFLEMIQIDSESRNELQMQKFLVEYLENLGFDVKTDNAGKAFDSNANNVIAVKKGNGDAVILSSHMDTVKPGNGVEPVIDGDIISSKGDTILGGDDKGGIAAILEAVETIVESGDDHPTIEIVFTVGEEIGLQGSKNLDYSLVTAKRALIFDTGGKIGTIITQAPGQNIIDFKVKGKTAHAGVAPEEGISAIQVASDAISNMNLLRIDNETTANIGFFNGGVATNIVTAEVSVIAEARSLNVDKLEAQTKHMIDTFEASASRFGAEVTYDVRKAYNPFVISEDSTLLKDYMEAFKDCSIEPFPTSTGGGSDCNNFNENGIESLNISVNMQKVHTTDEFIAISDLASASNVLCTYLKNQAK